MRLPRLFDSLRDTPAKDLPLGAGMALMFLVRTSTYGLAAVTGIAVARALGPHDRGVYSLVISIAFMFPVFAELGISKAGIYLVGQKKCSLQQLISNDLAWLLSVSAIWIAGIIALGLTRPAFLPDDIPFAYFIILALTGVFLLLILMAQDVVIAGGSILSYNAVEFTGSLLRSIIVVVGILLFGLGVTGVLSAWLLAVVLTAFVALYLMAKHGQLKPLLWPGLLKAQLSFGLRGHLGFMLQTGNYRLDVFLVAALAGSTALGHYAVAFGIAELLWQIPMTLGVVLFPKLSALDPEANTETALATCRRVVFITFLGTVAALVSGRFLIGFFYGSEFLPAVNAFYILAPSGLFYTIHKVLGSALAGRGMPQVTIYGGAASLPVTVGLDLFLIPRMGIEGAAVASIAAYAVNASVILAIFLWVTRRSILDTLLINRTDILSSVQMARSFLVRSQV